VFHRNRIRGPFLQSLGSVLLWVVVTPYEVFLTRCTVMRDGHPLECLPASSMTGVHPQQIARITFSPKGGNCDSGPPK
jgi:hypothetical protein